MQQTTDPSNKVKLWVESLTELQDIRQADLRVWLLRLGVENSFKGYAMGKKETLDGARIAVCNREY